MRWAGRSFDSTPWRSQLSHNSSIPAFGITSTKVRFSSRAFCFAPARPSASQAAGPQSGSRRCLGGHGDIISAAHHRMGMDMRRMQRAFPITLIQRLSSLSLRPLRSNWLFRANPATCRAMDRSSPRTRWPATSGHSARHKRYSRHSHAPGPAPPGLVFRGDRQAGFGQARAPAKMAL